MRVKNTPNPGIGVLPSSVLKQEGLIVRITKCNMITNSLIIIPAEVIIYEYKMNLINCYGYFSPCSTVQCWDGEGRELDLTRVGVSQDHMTKGNRSKGMIIIVAH